MGETLEMSCDSSSQRSDSGLLLAGGFLVCDEQTQILR